MLSWEIVLLQEETERGGRMIIKADYGNDVKLWFEVDGTEESTLDWEMPSWNSGYLKEVKE